MNQPYNANQFTNQNQPTTPNQNQQSQGFQPPQNQQAPQGNSVFDQVAGASPTEGGIYPKPGIYPLVFIDAVKMIRTRKGEDMFVAELCILNSEVAERPAGSRMSWCANFKHDAAASNVKLFLAAAMGMPVDSVDAAGMQFACSDQNPLYGRLLRIEASNIETRSGNPFTVCKWHAIADEHQARSEEYFKAAGFGMPEEGAAY
jgi:hypothetical protein